MKKALLVISYCLSALLVEAQSPPVGALIQGDFPCGSGGTVRVKIISSARGAILIGQCRYSGRQSSWITTTVKGTEQGQGAFEKNIDECFSNGYLNGGNTCHERTLGLEYYKGVGLSDGSLLLLEPRIIRIGNTATWSLEGRGHLATENAQGEIVLAVDSTRILKVNRAGGRVWPNDLTFPKGSFCDVRALHDGGFVMSGSGGTRRYGANAGVVWNNALQAHHIYQLADRNLLLWGEQGMLKVNLETGTTVWQLAEPGLRAVYPLSDNGSIALTATKLIRFDAQGQKVWEKDQAGKQFLIVTSAEEFIVGERIIGASPEQYKLTKFTQAGAQKWELTDTGRLSALQTAFDGGFYTAFDGVDAVSGRKYAADPCTLEATVAASTAEFCAGTSATLTAKAEGATGTVTYRWKREGTNVGENSATLTAQEGGTYTVEISDAAGCRKTAELTLRKSEPRVTLRADAAEFCAGGSTTLRTETAGGLGTYRYAWKKDGTTTGGTSGTLTEVKGGTYTVEVTDEKGCKATSGEQRITELPLPTVTLSTGAAFCEGSSLRLTAAASAGTGPYQYGWLAGTTPVGSNADSLRVTAAGTYTVRVTDSRGCVGTPAAPRAVTMNPAPRVTIPGAAEREFCRGGSTLLTAEVSPAGTHTFQWHQNGQALTGGAATVARYEAAQAGTFTVTVTDARGCRGTAPAVRLTQRNVNITASIAPVGATEVNEPATVTLNASAGLGYEYQWQHATPNDSVTTDLPGATGLTYVARTSGTYYVVVSAEGCRVRSAGVRVIVNKLTATTPEAALRMQLFPNPTQDRARVEVSTSRPETLRLQLINNQGIPVGEWTRPAAPAHAVELDLGAVPEGLYLLTIQAGPHRQTRKLVRMR
jgi:hypothetical protein